MYTRLVCGLGFTLVSAVSCPVFGQEDLAFSSNTVAVFDYNGQPKRLFASLRNNPDNVAQWQFRYDPLYLPQADKDKKLVVNEFEQPDHTIRLQIPISLDNKKARQLAYEQLKRTYKEQSEKLQPGVFALNVGTITVSMSLDDLNLGAKLVGPTTDFAAPTDTFNIVISVPNKDSAAVLKALLPQQKINYVVSFNAKSTRQNSVHIKYSDLENSALYAALHGLGTSETYVHRDDLRRLSENIHSQIGIDGIIEAPEQFDSTVFDKILNIMTTKTETAAAQFNAQKWQATYNGQDLAPDEIAKKLDKEFTWDEGSKTFKFNASVDTGGKVGLFDVLSAEGKAAGSYSQDDMQSWLKKHGVEASFEGHKIVPKSIELQKVNMNQFSSAGVFSSIITLVTDELKNASGSIDISDALDTGNVGTAIPGRVDELEEEVKGIEGRLETDERNISANTDAIASLAQRTSLLERKATAIYQALNFDYGTRKNNVVYNGHDLNAPDAPHCPRGSVLTGVRHSGYNYEDGQIDCVSLKPADVQ